MRVIIILFTIIFNLNSFSQSKKEQIEILNSRVDSLNIVLNSEKNTSSEKSNKISDLTTKITNQESTINTLNTNVSQLKSELQTSKSETSSKQQAISELQSQLNIKTDSLILIQLELSELKKNAQYNDLPIPYYSLHDACETSLDKCWKLGLCWDEDLMDYSTIHRSEMLFTYFPKKNSQCSDSTTYRLTPLGEPGGFAIWQYKNSNISIQVRLLLVETGFGYQLYDVRITNSLVNDCQPINFTGKY
ncbi:hypothetical protein N9I21_02800 [Crocinitomicaceae bacterium]|nr:hypothetical protein [Crocinitomicaceae bacterium]